MFVISTLDGEKFVIDSVRRCDGFEIVHRIKISSIE